MCNLTPYSIAHNFLPYSVSQALEPYQINFKDFIAQDKATNRKQCGWFLLLVLLVVLLVKGVYGVLLQKADQFAANYSYSIQCPEIESSFSNQNSSAFADYAILDKGYVTST